MILNYTDSSPKSTVGVMRCSILYFSDIILVSSSWNSSIKKQQFSLITTVTAITTSRHSSLHFHCTNNRPSPPPSYWTWLSFHEPHRAAVWPYYANTCVGRVGGRTVSYRTCTHVQETDRAINVSQVQSTHPVSYYPAFRCLRQQWTCNFTYTGLADL